jgi:hypothetical protein
VVDGTDWVVVSLFLLERRFEIMNGVSTDYSDQACLFFYIGPHTCNKYSDW